MEQAPAPRNLLTHFDETLALIASIEQHPGSRWLLEQSEAEADKQPQNVANALKWLRNKWKKPRWFIIDGDGGMNRWRVYPDGRVAFLKGAKAGNPDDARRAQELGFEVIDLEVSE